MPEEPDVNLEEEEILDRNIRKRIEARKQQRLREVGKGDAIANRILEALQSRPEGMTWAEIRGLFGKNQSDEQIRQALISLNTTTKLSRNHDEQTGERSSERFLLAAS
jgi:hypothetical protein